MKMENQWAVRTRDLCKAYHGRSVVDHLNLHVPHGCVYGFLGPNGAGKSTSMKMMLGLARPTSGSVELLGRKLDEESRIELLRETGSLIESPSGYLHLTARENLAIVCDLKGVSHREIDRVLDIVRLTGDANRRVGQYSLGMKQRLAIALAVKDSLSNVASGILIIITKPFKVGDYIEIEGLEGTVYKIELMFTTLITADNKNVILPNSRVSANNVVNYTAQETRRLDLNFSIGYNDDIQQAKGILQRLIDQDPRVVRREESIIGVFSQDESGVTLALKVWCNTSDYWDLHYALEEQVKLAFDQAGITIPYPQMDVHLVP